MTTICIIIFDICKEIFQNHSIHYYYSHYYNFFTMLHTTLLYNIVFSKRIHFRHIRNIHRRGINKNAQSIDLLSVFWNKYLKNFEDLKINAGFLSILFSSKTISKWIEYLSLFTALSIED